MTKQTQIARIATIALALMLILSVFGPIGTVSAQSSVSVTQTADSTTVAPGETVEFTATLTHEETNAPGLNVDLPDGWTITEQSADGPASYNPAENAWVWLTGGEDGVDNEYTVTYTVAVPGDADDGDYTVTAEGSAIDPSDGNFIYSTVETTISVEDDSEPEPEPVPADFRVSDLNVPASAVEGDEIMISADITNDGEESGTQTVVLLVNGDQTDSQALTLDGDASESVSFQYDTDGLPAGEYDVTVATDDDSASATLTVTEAPPENEPPIGSFTVSPTDPEVGQQVTFDASGSEDPDGTIESYEWEFGDGETASGESVTHTYDSAGEYDVTLTVTDNDGATDSTMQTVSVSEAPSAPANFQVSNLNAPATATQGDAIEVSADVTNDGDEEATQTVEFRLDLDGDGVLDEDEVLASQEVTLDAGETETVTFSDLDTSALEPGEYEHGVFTDDDSATATLSVEEAEEEAEELPPVGNFQNPPNDLNGDGLYEDINGDGKFDIVDVQALFANLDDETIQNNPDKFDFNQDGVVDVVDVQKLFAELVS